MPRTASRRRATPAAGVAGDRAALPGVGFVGLGIIGGAFSRHLLEGGFRVAGFDPDRVRLAAFAGRGGRRRASAAAVASGADVVVTALASLEAFEAAYFGRQGIAAGARRGCIVADVSTMPLELKLDAERRLAREGIAMLDCPISGTGAQAEVRDVAVYASGDAGAIERARPVLEGFSRKVWNAGAFGAASKLKFVANLLVTIHNVSAAEALTLGVKAGLAPELLLAALASGAGSSRMLEVRGPLMLADRYDEPTMKCDVYSKDISIIGAFAAGLDCPTPLFDASRALYSAALAQGRAGQDTAAVCAVLKEMAGLGTAIARPRWTARNSGSRKGRQ